MKLVIFDIDGTLTNTVDVDDICFAKAFKDVFGMDISGINWHRIKTLSSGTDTGMAMEIYRSYKKVLPDMNDIITLRETFTRRLKFELITHPEKFTEIPGARNFMRKLCNNSKIGVSVSTGSWKQSGLMKLAAAGMEIGDIPYSSSEFLSKRTEILDDVIQKSKKYYGHDKFDSMVYIGDGKWDYLSARELGIKFVGVDYERTGKLAIAGATDIIHDYTELDMVIKLIC
ncbi:MAG: HAD family hydrolase [Candidatus Kapaibacterium sp.]